MITIFKEINFPNIITEDLPEVNLPFEGGKAYLLQGAGQQLVFMEFDRDLEVPEHFHSAQWGIVVEGEMTLIMQGEELVLIKGDTYFIPKGVTHKARIKAGYKDITVYAQKDRFSIK